MLCSFCLYFLITTFKKCPKNGLYLGAPGPLLSWTPRKFILKSSGNASRLERKNNCLELLNKPAEMITVSSSTIYSPAHWSKSSRNEKRLHHPSKSSWATPDNFPNPNYIGKVRIITSLSSKITFVIHIINFLFLAICFTKLCWRSCVEHHTKKTIFGVWFVKPASIQVLKHYN